MDKNRTIIFALLLAGYSLLAADLQLAWEDNVSGITNHVVYATTNTLIEATKAAAQVRVNTGTNLTFVVDGIQPGQVWSFGVTAMADGVESDLSNVIIVQMPAAPTNLRTLIIQHADTLDNAGWKDVGFFRLKIP
jgi:hypothetical protein